MRIRLAPAQHEPLDLVGGRLAHPDQPPDLVIDLGTGSLTPGLVNAHDHLHRNHYPRLGTPPYPDAYAWGRDLHDRFADAIARAKQLPLDNALLFGAFRNLAGGVTTCVHHDPWPARLDAPFPVRVVRTRVVHSLGFEPEVPAAARGDAETATLPLCIHLAEGVTTAMADEVRDAAAAGLVDEALLAVHVVGADADGLRTLADRGAAVIWCPTSNAFLFGRTAPAALFACGLDVLLGTDSLLTAQGTMLDELAEARRLALLDDRRLLDAVGTVSARRIGAPAPTLAAGARADVVFWRRPVLEARNADVALVLVGGTPRYGDREFADLFRRSGVATDPIVVGGKEKLVAAPLGAVAERVFALSPECARIVA